MKIYTKTGDKGETSLVGGTRVAKDSPRLEAYGTVDELSSHLGLLVAMMREKSGELREDTELLKRIQNELFNVSTILATPPSAHIEGLAEMLERLPKETLAIEQRIDVLTGELPVLHSFIMPGGSYASAQCHVCRTVCRRAERRIVGIDDDDTSLRDYGNVRQYVNRMSDYLFVLARKINIIYGMEEKTWQNSCR